MIKGYQLTIDQPCSENWNKMTPTERGKHCQACDKIVTDFSGMSETQILEFLLQNPGSCGRVNKNHINKPIFLKVPAKKRSRNWVAIAAMLAAGLFSVQVSYSQTTDPLQLHHLSSKDFKGDKNTQRINTNNSEDDKDQKPVAATGTEQQQKAKIDSMITIKGTVFNDEKTYPYTDALVWLYFDENSGKGEVVDDKGNFEFIIDPKVDLQNAYLYIKRKDDDYEDLKINLDSLPMVNNVIEVEAIIQMKSYLVHVMGAIAVTRIYYIDGNRVDADNFYHFWDNRNSKPQDEIKRRKY